MTLETVEQVVAALEQGGILEHKHLNVELKSDWQQRYGEKLSALGNKLTVTVAWLSVGVDD